MSNLKEFRAKRIRDLMERQPVETLKSLLRRIVASADSSNPVCRCGYLLADHSYVEIGCEGFDLMQTPGSLFIDALLIAEARELLNRHSAVEIPKDAGGENEHWLF